MSIDGFIVAKNFETAGIHKYLQALVRMKEIGYSSKNGNVTISNLNILEGSFCFVHICGQSY
jgi:hypothetical protein